MKKYHGVTCTTNLPEFALPTSEDHEIQLCEPAKRRQWFSNYLRPRESNFVGEKSSSVSRVRGLKRGRVTARPEDVARKTNNWDTPRYTFRRRLNGIDFDIVALRGHNGGDTVGVFRRNYAGTVDELGREGHCINASVLRLYPV